MRLVAFLSDAFGGPGGIAQFNREVLDFVGYLLEQTICLKKRSGLRRSPRILSLRSGIPFST